MFGEVKIWGRLLKCDMCSNKHWHMRTLKTEFENEENAWEYTEEVRYLFECKECGNCRLFGMVANEKDEVNILFTEIPENLV